MGDSLPASAVGDMVVLRSRNERRLLAESDPWISVFLFVGLSLVDMVAADCGVDGMVSDCLLWEAAAAIIFYGGVKTRFCLLPVALHAVIAEVERSMQKGFLLGKLSILCNNPDEC